MSGGPSPHLSPWRRRPQRGGLRLKAADQAEFVGLASDLALVVARLDNIEFEIRRTAERRSSRPAEQALWRGALLARRGAELRPLRAEGQRLEAALQEFAEDCGFASAEQLAYVCGMASPCPRAGDAEVWP